MQRGKEEKSQEKCNCPGCDLPKPKCSSSITFGPLLSAKQLSRNSMLTGLPPIIQAPNCYTLGYHHRPGWYQLGVLLQSLSLTPHMKKPMTDMYRTFYATVQELHP